MRVMIINYKAYKEAIDKGVYISQIASKASKDFNVDVYVAPTFTMLRDISKIIPTISQGIHVNEPGPYTGHITWYEIKSSGAVGVLLNHSENRILDKDGKLDYTSISKSIEICRSHELKCFVCVENIEEAKNIVGFNPTGIAYEPPELIGGDISVSTAKPEIVREFCKIVKENSESLALIGAGIKTPSDVSSSINLGADGILIASGVMKSSDIISSIRSLIEPLK